MVRRGVLPHLFLEMIPVILFGARLLAAAMILFGLGRFLAVSGWLSAEWIGRYGFALLLVVLGLALLAMTFRERRRP
jgi:hypothetical protein